MVGPKQDTNCRFDGRVAVDVAIILDYFFGVKRLVEELNKVFYAQLPETLFAFVLFLLQLLSYAF